MLLIYNYLSSQSIMTISDLVDVGKSLVFAKVVCINLDNPDVPWVICHKLDLQTRELIWPLQSVFVNAQVLKYKYQFMRIGPFFTPYKIELDKYGLPEMDDIVVGKTSSNSKGTIYNTFLPDRWARPIFYFFHYLTNVPLTKKIYFSRDTLVREGMISFLSVCYGKVHDQRLYDLLVLILFDTYDALIDMCRKQEYKVLKRDWSLQSESLCRQIGEWLRVDCYKDHIHIPNCAEFVEETSFLIREPTLVNHFKTLLQTYYKENPSHFVRYVNRWFTNPDILNVELHSKLCDYATLS